MEKTVLASIVLASFVALMICPAMAKPQTFTVSYKQAQYQWRAWNVQPSTWSPMYQNRIDETEYKFTGNVLHMAFEYSPAVSGLEEEKSIYVFDGESGLWIQHEGTIKYKYVPYYGDYWVENYWRGYVEFDGDPSSGTFEQGVAYQWVYVYARAR